MKIQTQALIGRPLSWAVATCSGYAVDISKSGIYLGGSDIECSYSDDWGQAGPIIEQESISIQMAYPADDGKPALWYAAAFATSIKAPPRAHGPTPLVAAMRCFVLSKLGEEVDVPGGLLEGK